ncbi:MAG: FG-GAP repeat protein [Phycisphaerae bacterium]|nr:FG-GAP repeat protein [Phycisphaerae bacterium]
MKNTQWSSRIGGWLAYGAVGIMASVVAPAGADCAPVEVAKLTASDGGMFDIFGLAFGFEGDTAVIGSMLNDQGAAYRFERNGNGVWMEEGTLEPRPCGLPPYFGHPIVMEGNMVVVGAGGENCKLYVFERAADGSWEEQDASVAVRTPENTWAMPGSVAIAGDTLLAGSPGDDELEDDAGAVYVCKRNEDGRWLIETRLLASDGDQGDAFGTTLSLSGDTLAVSAPRRRVDGEETGLYGGIYIFTRSAAGTWDEHTKLTPTDTEIYKLGEVIGLDGDTLLARVEHQFVGDSVYVFERDSLGNWTQRTELLPSDASYRYEFGRTISIDGDTALIGATSHTEGCAVFVFTRNEVGTWTERAKLVGSGVTSESDFGQNTALRGTVAMIADLAENMFTGTVYVYDLSACEPLHVGDCNCDGAADAYDIDAFVTAILFPADYADTYPECDVMLADCNGDGVPDVFDIDAFVDVILGG